VQGTDVLVLVVTAIVFLAGFSSLRLHTTFAERRRVLEDVVGSVTTTPGFADRLRQNEVELGQATNGGGWKEAALRLASSEDLALHDRDMRVVAPVFGVHAVHDEALALEAEPEDGCGSACRFRALTRAVETWFSAWVPDLIALATSGVVVSLVIWLWSTAFAGYPPQDLRIARIVGTAVATISLIDLTSVSRRHEHIRRTVNLRSPTLTSWRFDRMRDRGDDGGEAQGRCRRHQGGEARAALVLAGRQDDALNILGTSRSDEPSSRDQGDSASSGNSEASSARQRGTGVLASASRRCVPSDRDLIRATQIVPEWSTPLTLMALQSWRRTRFEPSRSLDESTAAALRARRSRGLAVASRAAALNPFDPASRVILAALTIDALASALRDQDMRNEVCKALGGSAVEAVSSDAVHDGARQRRWLFSLALRRAREASILEWRVGGGFRGGRVASGRITELDRIAVEYQLARAYLLSSCENLVDPVNRENAEKALEHFQNVDSLIEGWGPLSEVLGPSPHLELVPLCLDPAQVREAWKEATAERIAQGASAGGGPVDPWALPQRGGDLGVPVGVEG
jgi:hypothetical protein